MRKAPTNNCDSKFQSTRTCTKKKALMVNKWKCLAGTTGSFDNAQLLRVRRALEVSKQIPFACVFFPSSQDLAYLIRYSRWCIKAATSSLSFAFSCVLIFKIETFQPSWRQATLDAKTTWRLCDRGGSLTSLSPWNLKSHFLTSHMPDAETISH